MFNETGIIVKEKTRTNLSLPHNSIDLVETTAAIELLIAEMGEGFYNYVNWIGLAKDPNLIVLSSQHYYFYDAEEMNNVKTVINLKELNKIKRVKSLLQSYLHFLPQKSNYIGYFVDNKKIDRYSLRDSPSHFDNKKKFEHIDNNIISCIPFINMLYSKMDLRTNSFMSERSVTSLLRDYGFKVLNLTEHEGFTFFHSQKVAETFN